MIGFIVIGPFLVYSIKATNTMKKVTVPIVDYYLQNVNHGKLSEFFGFNKGLIETLTENKLKFIPYFTFFKFYSNLYRRLFN